MGAVIGRFTRSSSNGSGDEPITDRKGFPAWNSYIKSDEAKSLQPKDRIITEEELSIHCNEYDIWVALQFKDKLTVFDVTKFAEYHPGGFKILLNNSGKNATEAFKKVHAYVNLNAISKCQVGYLQTDSFNKTDKPDFQDSKSTRSWSVKESTSELNLTVNLKHRLMQGLDQVSLILRDGNNFHLRIFQDTEYYVLDIDLIGELMVNLNSLTVSDDQYSVSILLVKSSDISVSDNIGTVKAEQWIPCENVYDDLPFIKCRVISNEGVTHDTHHLQLLIPETSSIRYPLGHHLLTEAHIDGESLTRPYSPIAPSLLNPEKELANNKLHLLFKVYPDGQMTNHLAKLQAGDELMVSPTVGNMTWSLLTDRTSALFLVAGTGLTAVQKIVHEILYNRSEIKIVHFLYFNKTESDIIIRDDITELGARFTDRFLVTYVLSAADSSWAGHRGRVSDTLLREVVPELTLNGASKDRICFVCGPIPFHKSATIALKNFSVPEELIFEFKG